MDVALDDEEAVAAGGHGGEGVAHKVGLSRPEVGPDLGSRAGSRARNRGPKSGPRSDLTRGALALVLSHSPVLPICPLAL